MKHALAASALLIVAAGLGFFYQDDPYRLARVGYPQDQAVLAHRDSPYAHITWVVSDSRNYAQLRFYNNVEGGVCLHPSWAELTDLNARSVAAGAPAPGPLAHLLKPAGSNPRRSPADTWPEGRTVPDLGTLANSEYVRTFPLGVLLNDRLLTEAGGDPRRARPDILVVGLGSGVGIAVLAHHFPQASITVVDIDPVVIDVVMGHYPLLAWLAGQKTDDGRPRLRLTEREAHDARQYIKHDEVRADGGRDYDVVILDAYTDGSTIPPHLMTREFFVDIANIMPDDGMVLANLIGSYSGPKRLLLGGAMRSLMAAGLEQVHNFPIDWSTNDPTVADKTRNNIVLAGREPLTPDARPGAWERLRAFTPYPHLPIDSYLSHEIVLLDAEGKYLSSSIGLPQGPAAEAAGLVGLVNRLESMVDTDRESVMERVDRLEGGAEIASRLRAFVARRHPEALGWDEHGQLFYRRTDWVRHARATWKHAMEEAEATTSGRRFKHAGTTLVGPADPARRDGSEAWTIPDAPLFTDARPNADLYNR